MALAATRTIDRTAEHVDNALPEDRHTGTVVAAGEIVMETVILIATVLITGTADRAVDTAT